MAYGKNPVQEEFEAELEWNIKTLENNIDLLEDKDDRRFARSLTNYYDKFGYLSDKQLFRAAQFWSAVNALGATQANTVSKVVKEVVADKVIHEPIVKIDATVLLAKFDKAAEELKYPSIEYLIGDSADGKFLGVTVAKIKFARTGANSKHPGGILVSDGVPWPQGKIFAQIKRDATVVLHTNIWEFPQFQQFLKKIIESPDIEFATNGKRFGNCCFCGKELTTKESLDVGYGPICAGKWGLPWGEVSTSLDMEI